MNKIVQQALAVAYALGQAAEKCEDQAEIDVYVDCVDAMLGAASTQELQVASLQASFVLYGEDHRLQPPPAPAPNPDR